MSNKDTCDVYSYDEDKVNQIQSELENEDIKSVAKLFKAIAEENRAKITFALLNADELCVCDIANVIGVTVANASHHLRTLHNAGIVKFRKEGKLAFYSLDDDHVKTLFMNALEHGKEVNCND
ncbi:ArsR/SmtB family transcription factor [Nosocomiicoccus ampullae]|uniref:DNA-binding transcriptional ArsR family regulator n=1 Tax=Nosocomiicoccus ampullae TaxID=489910 RepID=A0A9Q2HFN5_9STAP|nr:metalloregulator ArsR/SmtB family transcription factor [Nosocomiicoccus ampullae]MBB5176318.1 DNA-binding transcriptional ArsR family regulator [Nosocomiicoccus ampullae]QYA47478.1 metalloregulator ArsR/SmtB family transcription factor [Nosocomiicoccus ampullae]